MKYRNVTSVAVLLCVSIGLWHAGSAAWIVSKAYLATYLIRDAWQVTLANGQVNKPWSWADTWPVAALSVPVIGLSEIVLAGDSGASLAFGPGLSSAGASANSNGVKLISAHRDTHFRQLGKISIDDAIYIDTPAGRKQYRVSGTKVVDSRRFAINPLSSDYDLVLATCYPFDALNPGGFERYLVLAEAINSSR